MNEYETTRGDKLTVPEGAGWCLHSWRFDDKGLVVAVWTRPCVTTRVAVDADGAHNVVELLLTAQHALERLVEVDGPDNTRRFVMDHYTGKQLRDGIYGGVERLRDLLRDGEAVR